MKKIVFFLDIDDCLIQTSRLTQDHLRAIKNQLSSLGVSKVLEITKEFSVSFRRLYDRHQGRLLNKESIHQLNKYLIKLHELEKPVFEKYNEVKRWSREVCLFIAGEKNGVKLSNKILVDTAHTLWEEITKNAIFYPDAKIFLDKLLTQHIPFYLITSSDSRLILKDESGFFSYDPMYSKKLKQKRLAILTDMGIPLENIFIGDPFDKPKTWVFENALTKAKVDIKEEFISIMVGDSLTNDLIPAQIAGMDKFILIKRDTDKKKIKSPKGIVILKSFSNLNINSASL